MNTQGLAKGILISVVAIVAVSNVRAAVVFSDTFESYTPALNQTSFGGTWTVSNGSVDVVENFGGVPTKTIDLDGSSGDAGVFTSTLLPLTAGDYALTYFLAGSRRGDTNTVTVSMSGIAGASQPHTLASADGPTMFTLNFSLLGPVSSSIVFDHAGGDNLGLLLDNVTLIIRDPQPPTGVPDTGASISLLSAALGLLAYSRRRWSK
jgi:hypothetical protein